MDTLEINRKAFFSWEFDVLQNGAPAGRIEGLGWPERSIVTLGQAEYEVSADRSGIDAFNLDSNGLRLAHVEKPHVFTRVLDVSHADKVYTFRRSSLFSSKYELMDNEQTVGSVFPKGALKKGAIVELPDQFQTPFKLFLGWVALVLWKRQAEVDAVATSACV